MGIKADDVGAQTEGIYEKDGKWFWMFQGKGAGPFNSQEEAEEDLKTFSPKDIEGADMKKYESYVDKEGDTIYKLPYDFKNLDELMELAKKDEELLEFLRSIPAKDGVEGKNGEAWVGIDIIDYLRKYFKSSIKASLTEDDLNKAGIEEYKKVMVKSGLVQEGETAPGTIQEIEIYDEEEEVPEGQDPDVIGHIEIQFQKKWADYFGIESYTYEIRKEDTVESIADDLGISVKKSFRAAEEKIINYKGFKIKVYKEDDKWTWGMPGTAESFGPGLPNMHETEKGALDEAKAYVEGAGDELKSSIKADFSGYKNINIYFDDGDLCIGTDKDSMIEKYEREGEKIGIEKICKKVSETMKKEFAEITHSEEK
jgi:hypothetical protein